MFVGSNFTLISEVDQDTYGTVTIEPRGHPFPSRWPQGCKGQTRQHNKDNRLGYEFYLSHDVASWSDITSCNKFDTPLVVYRCSGNVMTSITTLRIYHVNTKFNVFYVRNEISK